MQGGAVVEVEFVGDLLDRGVQEDVAAVQDDDRVDDVLQVAHLVGGDHDGGVFGRVLHQGGAELRLGRDVQAVGRLVEIEEAGAAGEGEGDVGLLELAGGHGVHLLCRVDLEFAEDLLEGVEAEVRPEFAAGLGPADGLVVDGGNLVGEVILILQEGGLALPGVAAVRFDGAGLRLLQAAEEGQERRLADAVLTEKTIDLARLQVHGDVPQDLIFSIAECQIVDVYHCFCSVLVH